ncbi:MAG: hypothetical protein Q8R55_05530 [Candidatus Taylorbacteria bacterium]|nr:hypothetical protein [Candidatus Taylorbacteria bacterium]
MKAKRKYFRSARRFKSEEQIEDEKLRKPVRVAIRALKRSKILSNTFPQSSLPKDLFFRKPRFYFDVARIFVSLAKHQEERKKIGTPLRDYQKQLEQIESELVKLPAGMKGIETRRDKIRVRYLICKELLKYSQYEHKDQWKDLAYWKLFKIFRYIWKLKYDDTIELMAKLAVLFGQAAVSCKEVLSERRKSFVRYFPAYSRDGMFRIRRERVRLVSDNKLKRGCPDFCMEDTSCIGTYCAKEKANIAKRISRLHTIKNKGLYFYDEPEHKEMTWRELLNETKTFRRFKKKKLLRHVPISDLERYLEEEVKHVYLKHHIDSVLLAKILRHLKLDPDKYTDDLLSDKEFLQAALLQL